MSLELADFISQLVQSNPEGSDPKSRGDDHLRLIKHVLQTQFSGFTLGKPITRNEDEINALMFKGNYGLGSHAVDITETAMSGPDLPCGFYYVSAQGLSALPLNENSWLLQFDISNPGFAEQWCVPITAHVLYRRELLGGVWQPWVQQWDTKTLPGQANVLDTLNNPVMRTTSFGLVVPIVAAPSTDINGLVAAFRFIQTSDSFVNRPGPAAATNGILEWIPANGVGNYGIQKFTDTNNARSFYRFRLNNVWDTWQEQPRASNTVLANPGCISLGPLTLHWGSGGPLADEQAVGQAFARSNPNGTVAVVAQIVGPGIANVTFQELDVYGIDANGFQMAYRTNGSNAVYFNWIALGIA